MQGPYLIKDLCITALLNMTILGATKTLMTRTN